MGAGVGAGSGALDRLLLALGAASGLNGWLSLLCSPELEVELRISVVPLEGAQSPTRRLRRTPSIVRVIGRAIDWGTAGLQRGGAVFVGKLRNLYGKSCAAVQAQHGFTGDMCGHGTIRGLVMRKV